MRRFLTTALARLPIDIEACATGAEAMAIAEDGRPLRAALVDGILPDTTGLELFRQMIDASGTRHAALCLLSGTVLRSRTLGSGVSAIAKPPHLTELMTHVEAMIDGGDAGGTRDQRLAALAELEAQISVGR